MGLAFRRAAKEGTIERTRATVQSKQDGNHGRDVTVWASRVFG